MKIKTNRMNISSVGITALCLVLVACGTGTERAATGMSDSQLEDLVSRSYQCVAMNNVNNKGAIRNGGWNTCDADTELKDHTLKLIARPNNDVLYQLAMLDLRKDAIVFEIPVIESKFVSMMATGYDHYVNIPMSTVDGPLEEPQSLLFYTQRTEGYNGGDIEGIDKKCEMTGDFISLVMRVMPHANEPERYSRIVDQINAIKAMSLSEFQGKPKPVTDKVDFPPYGKTDADIFENNLLEVMQFVFNHTTFDPDFELDREVLRVYAPLGIEPGKEYKPENVAKIDGKKFREISIKVRDEEIAKMNNRELMARLLPTVYQPKGMAGLESLLLVSVVGPIGQPDDRQRWRSFFDRRARLEGRRTQRHHKNDPFRNRIGDCRLQDTTFQSRRYRKCESGPGRLQGATPFRVSRPTGA
jgi:hypothetical protein